MGIHGRIRRLGRVSTRCRRTSTRPAAPLAEEEEDDDFDWSHDLEEGCGAQMQEAMEASLRSVRDDRVQGAKTACQLKANEASELAWVLKDSSSMDLALRRKRVRENRAAAHGAGSSRRSPNPTAFEPASLFM